MESDARLYKEGLREEVGLELEPTVSRQSGDCEWVCRRSWALKSRDSAERRQPVKTHQD
jgi:hypothetical protein